MKEALSCLSVLLIIIFGVITQETLHIAMPWGLLVDYVVASIVTLVVAVIAAFIAFQIDKRRSFPHS
jgi:hypothetical protein